MFLYNYHQRFVETNIYEGFLNLSKEEDGDQALWLLANISSYLHTDLNANVFTRGSRKGLGQKSAQPQDFKDQPNLGA